MGIVAERHLDVGVAHDVLQRLGVHALHRHVGAKGVAQRVCRHHLRQREPVALPVLADHATEHAGVALRDPRHPPRVEKEEVPLSFDDDGFPASAPCQHPPERLEHLVAHVDDAVAALRLGLCDAVAATLGKEELVVHANAALHKVDVRPRETA